jgi:hypothetical protein
VPPGRSVTPLFLKCSMIRRNEKGMKKSSKDFEMKILEKLAGISKSTSEELYDAQSNHLKKID